MHLKAGAVQCIKTSQSGGHKRQETDIALKKVVVLEMFFDLVASSLLNWAISVFEISDTQGAVGVLLATSVNLGGIGRAGLSGLWLRYPLSIQSTWACMQARGYVRAPCPDEAQQAACQ